MSWHACAILIHQDRGDDPVALFEALGFPGAVRTGTASFDGATSIMIFDAFAPSSMGASIAVVYGWTSIWGPFLDADEDALARISQEGDVFTLILEGSTGTYGFSWYRDGKKLRQFASQGGTIDHDEGDPLAEEVEVFASVDDGEERIFRLMKRLGIPWGDGPEYEVYRFGDE